MSDTIAGADTQAAAGAVAASTERYGHFRVGNLLGRGGMGEVVSATDERFGREVAIKRMRFDSPELVARFLREAKIQARLDHPAIVPVHELGHDSSGRPYFVMKQLRGRTLAQVLQQLAAGNAEAAARFTRQRLLRAFADVCLAVELAHSRGVIHRDLKPANITLGDFGEVYVLDWGIARVADEAEPGQTPQVASAGETAAGTVLGTTGYMSPEQANGDVVDARADVYALGCILFEILAGEPLDTRDATTRAGTDEGRPATRAPHRNVAPELDDACARATRPRRDERIATARELGALVERYLDGDRDVAHRKALAATAFSQARGAMARGDTEADRRDAMRAAGRALALDPDSTEIAELVGRLMLERPTTIPAEVERDMVRLEQENIEGGSRIAIRNGFVTFTLIPLSLLAGIRSVPLLAISAAATSLFLWMRARIVHRGVFSRAAVFGMQVGGALSLAAMSYMFSPLLSLAYAVHLTARAGAYPGLMPRWSMVAMAIIGCVVPAVLGAVGVGPELMTIEHGALVVHTGASTLEPSWTVVYLAFNALILMLATATTFSGTIERERAARRATLLQAWQLRQLVPKH